jgi:hypothetical protein
VVKGLVGRSHNLELVEKTSHGVSCRAESRHGLVANNANCLKENASRLRSMRLAMTAFLSFRYVLGPADASSAASNVQQVFKEGADGTSAAHEILTRHSLTSSTWSRPTHK